jgi:hypothetical protein
VCGRERCTSCIRRTHTDSDKRIHTDHTPLIPLCRILTPPPPHRSSHHTGTSPVHRDSRVHDLRHSSAGTARKRALNNTGPPSNNRDSVNLTASGRGTYWQYVCVPLVVISVLLCVESDCSDVVSYSIVYLPLHYIAFKRDRN